MKTHLLNRNPPIKGPKNSPRKIIEFSQPEMNAEAWSSHLSRRAASISWAQVGMIAAERAAPSKTIETAIWPIEETFSWFKLYLLVETDSVQD